MNKIISQQLTSFNSFAISALANFVAKNGIDPEQTKAIYSDELAKSIFDAYRSGKTLDEIASISPHYAEAVTRIKATTITPQPPIVDAPHIDNDYQYDEFGALTTYKPQTPYTAPTLQTSLWPSHLDTRDEAIRKRPNALVEGVLYEGDLLVYVGESGTCKTFNMLDMATALANGQRWLGRATKQCRVGYLDQESGEYTIHNRLLMVEKGRFLDQTFPKGIYLKHFEDIDLLTNTAIIEQIISTNALDVLFIDVLSGIHSGDENTQKDMTIVMNALLHATKTLGCAIVLAHHTNKSGTYRGSTLIKNKCDTLINVQRVDDSTVKINSEKVRNASPFSIKATNKFSSGGVYELLVQDEDSEQVKPVTKKASCAEAIMSELSTGQKVNWTPLKDAVLAKGYKRSTFDEALASLVNEQLIGRTTQGKSTVLSLPL